MNLELSGADITLLADLLKRTIDDARYPLSPRVTKLREVLGKLRPSRPASPCRRGRSMSLREPADTEGVGEIPRNIMLPSTNRSSYFCYRRGCVEGCSVRPDR
jgi:hypothetical protein